MIIHQPLLISLRQLVDNPTGKGSAYVAKRSMIKQGLNATYLKILQRYRKQFYAVPYTYPDGRIMFHVKVPSESYNINKISYDVLFEFDNNRAKALPLRNVRCFSNSPSIIFTYAYVFYKKSLIIPAFLRNLPTECKTLPPAIRNPVESMGWEKSIYIAARYLLDSYALSDGYIRKFGKPCNSAVERIVSRTLADPMTLVSVYQHARYLHARSHRKPLNQSELKRRNERTERFREKQKRVRPTSDRSILGIKLAPRAKISIHKTRKALLNDKSKPTVKYNHKQTIAKRSPISKKGRIG